MAQAHSSLCSKAEFTLDPTAETEFAKHFLASFVSASMFNKVAVFEREILAKEIQTRSPKCQDCVMTAMSGDCVIVQELLEKC